jgi:penicillin-insensitive murein endopeptidase
MQRTPAPGPAQVFGRTTSGCIAGAAELPTRGQGFVRRRPWRPTGFGHPDLVAYVERLGEAVKRAGLGTLQVGDMSLPRGGLFMRDHVSHQTGLDVDIAYKTLMAPGELHPVGAAGPAFISARDARHIEALLRLAAADPRVDRIFVGARIKQLLCGTAVSDRAFLDVLRPWLGHEKHFHVRLKCPADSPDCRPNEPVTTIADSCEAVSHWWRTNKVPLAYARWRTAERTSYARELPLTCQALPEPVRMTARISAALTTRRVAKAPNRALLSPPPPSPR